MILSFLLIHSMVTVSAQTSVTRVCSLQVVLDNFLWTQQKEKLAESGGNITEVELDRITRFHLISLISRVVNEANKVLDSYYFNNSKYKLSLKNLQILEEAGCTFKDSFLCGTESLQTLLNTFSSINHDEYCLSYLFTFRDFPGGSIGLAWTATTTNGGICDKHGLHIHDEDSPHVNRSLNTGVVSLSRNNIQVSERIAALTFSHEIGHSFGAPHDSGGCEGGGEAGHFLMHETGSLGLQPRNMELSPCSRGNMTQVVSTRHHCWTVDTSAQGVCGNGIVEGWEECDCGDAEQCRDQCCVPLGDPGGRRPCRLVQGAQCSPSEGLCCGAQCEFLSPDMECAPASECGTSARCQGRNPICPLAQSLPDNTLCEEDSRTCQGGQCTGSVCQKHGLSPCQPSEISDPAASCSPHCRSVSGGCEPLTSVLYPEASECQLAGGYGHCSARGACQVGAGDEGPGWLVGLILFLVFYSLASLAVTWVYCMYCRGGRLRAKSTPVISSGNSEEDIVEDGEEN